MSEKKDKHEAPKEKKVKVLSLRKGDVELEGGLVLKYKQTVEVSPEVADWLVDSFKELMLKV